MPADLLRLLITPLIGALAALILAAAVPAGLMSALRAAPWILALSAALLGWRFRQGNMTLLALAAAATWGLVDAAPPGRAHWTTLPVGASVYLPLATLATALWRERGLLNRYGVLRLLGLLFPAAAVLAHHRSGAPAPLWMTTQFTSMIPDDAWPPQAALLLTLAAVGAILWRHRRQPNSMDGGALALVVLGAVGVALVDSPVGRAAWFSAGCGALLTAMVQTGYRVAFHDELTGIPGRRALKSYCAGLGPDYALAMLDVDHFKKFNDTYGHDVGDDVLVRVAKVISSVGGGGRAFRYGGEEFTVVFDGKTADEATPWLDEVRRAMCGTPFVIRRRGAGAENAAPPPPSSASSPATSPAVAAKKTPAKKAAAPKAAPDSRPGAPALDPLAREVTIAISIGVADCRKGAATLEQVMKQADEALYRAKQGGRNRVSL